MSKIWRKALAYILATIMCFSVINVPVYAHESIVTDVSMETENANEATTEELIIFSNDAEASTWDQVTTEKIFEGENFKVTFTLTSYWETGYNANIKLENTGNSTIQNWYLGFDYHNSITNIWNAEISLNEGEEYVIKNVGWNQDIAAGSSVEFGISGDHAFKGFPENYELIGISSEVAEGDYTIQYNVNNDWGTGFYGSISVTNNTDTVLEEWILEFDFDREITEIWDGVIEEHESNHYIVRNAEYNSVIAPGKTISIGIKGCGGEAVNEPHNYILFSFNCAKELEILSVSKEMMELNNEHYDLGPDFSTFSGELKRADEVTNFVMRVYDKNEILIYETNIVPEQQWKADNIALIYGINKVVFEACIGTKVDVEELIVECKDNYNFNELILDLDDTDGDGIQNYFEFYFGTDVNCVDTDNDGLNDYQELYELGYDARSVDSDNNGILDSEEDEDGDGISNLMEYDLGSSPLDVDSDNDRLEDGIELKYGTSLIKEDSDEDGISDYEEYYMNNVNATFDASNKMYTVEFSADEMGILYDKAVIPSITLTADAEGILSFAIERVESNYILNPFMVGYMGAAYDFSAEGSMLGAKLTFTYDESLIDDNMINSEDFCPTIYYYNPDDGTLSEVEGQTWNDNRVSVELEHFSIYILVNKADLERFWKETVELEEGSNIASGNHVVFVMDRSGSMSGNDPYFIRTSLVKEFWAKMGKNDKIGLVGFSNTGIKYSESLTNEESVVEGVIELFESQSDSGGTYMNNGIELAVELLEKETDTNVKKSIFILTDGYTSDQVSSAYLSELVEKNITIYTVGMGTVSQSYLQNIASSTGGKYFYVRNSSGLSEIFIDFEDEIDYDKNDDGLNDELTKLICKGEITTCTGTKVFCSEKNESSWQQMYEKIMESDDLDGDGLKNGEEIEIYYVGEKPYIYLISSPEIIDTDCDLKSDYEEIMIYSTKPLLAEFTVDVADYTYFNSYKNFESGKAYGAYFNRSDFAMVSEYLFNVIICGGEAQMNKIARTELLDLFVTYAGQNSEQLAASGVLNVANAYLRGILDLMPGLGLEAERFLVNQKINNIQQQILSLRGVDYSKPIKKLLKTEIKDLNSMFSKHADKAGVFSKYGGYIGLGASAIAIGFQSFEEFAEYSASLEIVCNYENILNELKYCGAGNVEYAAQKVSEDMQSVFEKYKTGGANFLLNLSYYGSTAYASYLIAGMGPAGLAADLVWLAADSVVGNALSTKITNFVTVECANGVTLATGNVFLGAKYQTDVNGNMMIVNSGDDKTLSARNMTDICIFARQWAEAKYLVYLQDESWFFDADHFLYHEDDSEEKAQTNIIKLNELNLKY